MAGVDGLLLAPSHGCGGYRSVTVDALPPVPGRVGSLVKAAAPLCPRRVSTAKRMWVIPSSWTLARQLQVEIVALWWGGRRWMQRWQ